MDSEQSQRPLYYSLEGVAFILDAGHGHNDASGQKCRTVRSNEMILWSKAYQRLNELNVCLAERKPVNKEIPVLEIISSSIPKSLRFGLEICGNLNLAIIHINEKHKSSGSVDVVRIKYSQPI